jgi:hypothetical protein
MENTSTPIENLRSMGDDTQEQSGMSASEQILKKYIELENQTPERAQINEGQEQRQLDPALANQHRMMELERARQFQMQQQVTRNQGQQPPPQKSETKASFLSNIKDMAGGLMELFSGPLLVVVLFILFNLGIVDKTLTRLVPFLANQYGNLNIKGVVIKALLAGIIFFVAKLFI